MIRPTKHLELKTCVINVAYVILTQLQKNQAAQLDDLDSLVQDLLGETARFNVIPALSFLYLIGKIDYQNKSDVIYLLEPQSE